MWQCHMITFVGDRQKLLNALDLIPEVLNWRAALGGVFVVTPATVTSSMIAEKLAPKYPDLRFVISAIYGNMTNGRADAQTWEFINNPSPMKS